MKLATLHDGSRDGQLVVVARDLSTAHLAAHVAGTLQQVLDDWNFLSPQLEDLYATLNGGKARHAFPFDPRQCLAPLPRAHLWAAGGQLARSDAFLRPLGRVPQALQGLQPWLHWVAVTGDIAPGLDDASALDGVRLLLLALTWGAPAVGDAQPAGVRASAFAPVAATPDELGPAWRQAARPAAWAEPLSLRRLGRAGAGAGAGLADTLVAGAEAAPPVALTSLGLGPALLALARDAAGLGLPAGSLVGAPALAAGAPWAAGDRIQLAARGLDGHSLVGSIDLQADAAEVADTPAPADARAAA